MTLLGAMCKKVTLLGVGCNKVIQVGVECKKVIQLGVGCKVKIFHEGHRRIKLKRVAKFNFLKLPVKQSPKGLNQSILFSESVNLPIISETSSTPLNPTLALPE